VCAAAYCSGNTSYKADTCDGIGNCQDNGTQVCFPYICNTSTGLCKSPCSTSADCQTGYSCKSGVCLKNDGQTCGGDGECYNGKCCSGYCRNTTNDVNNCGACGTQCTNGHGTTSCTSSVCTPVCDPLWGDCDTSRNNGCERATNTLTDCGGCNVACDLAHASESCSTGSCLITSCESGYENCDGAHGNGCEVGHGSYGNTCGGAEYLGSKCGDLQYEIIPFILCGGTNWETLTTRTGRTSYWFKARANECSNCCADVWHWVTLQVPSGINYDVCLWAPCGSLVGCATDNGAGGTDGIGIYRTDDCGGADSGFDYWIEVKFISGNSCSNWTLTVEGRSD
jgi:hypothetical protein